MTFYHGTPGNKVLCGQAGNTVNVVILTKGTLEQGIVSAFVKIFCLCGPARLGRLPVKEEIFAGSNPVRGATSGKYY